MNSVTPVEPERLRGIRRAIVLEQVRMEESRERVGYWLDCYVELVGVAALPERPPKRSNGRRRSRNGSHAQANGSQAQAN